ncbi:MAG: sulfatase-like hydrolase/transferase, partial [bacterium]|nr:sulfatase-like hydrolase/transferase [bacterium]
MAAASRKPNILVIFADDLGYGELGCQGNPQIPTPHIDSLARNGVRFTDGYVTASVCSPSRAGMITGRYQTRFGHEFLFTGHHNLDPNAGLPAGERTLADYLGAAGYATGLVGKWHLGGRPEYHPQRRGFQEFYGFLHEGHYYVPPADPYVYAHLRNPEPTYDADNPILRGTEPVEEKEYLTRALTREALAFIDRHAAEPFFLYLAYNAVHSPMQTLPEDFARFGDIQDYHRRIFAGMLAAMDDSLGAVLAGLRKHGLEDDTLIFYISDNGGPTEELTSSNAPLRGGKGHLWEGGIRTPFLMQWKARIPGGQVYMQPVIALDVLPTALAAAGVPLPTGVAFDGVDLAPYLTGQKSAPPHETLYWRSGGVFALRRGHWKLVNQPEPGQPARFRLYDLAADIGETTDRSADEPELARQLKAELDALDKAMVPPVWRPGQVPPPAPPPAPLRPDRPNILWLVAEDLGPHLGCDGTKEVWTPNLDRLAVEGVRYPNAFTTAPVCSPSRSAFMTGMYQTTIGAHNHRSHRDDGYRLPAGVGLFTERMRQAGYTTANIRRFPPALYLAGTGKTDWNFTIDGNPWDTDRWEDLRERQPFCAQVNFIETHRLAVPRLGWPWNAAPRADPAKVEIPPYYPDHPLTRRDWAGYLDSITELE